VCACKVTPALALAFRDLIVPTRSR